ncbi:lymphocyte expansion molecule-like [Denticeps clupeoides]|uniref:lymphocyte expansion molecule-like n=1 Tax=Denticeps clupeoides TaxID=299321 RepID=UPI0010A455D5|nr:lymphocyte expansion molecule [Denticeps clupeoides]
MAAEKKFHGAPFGTQSARFDVSAVHPAKKRVGAYIPYSRQQERTLGPGTYNVYTGDFSATAVQERAKGPGWRRAQETSRWAQMPRLLYREAWENKQLLKKSLGPGSYKSTDFVEELEKKPGSVRGVCSSRDRRFPEAQSWTPGPGTYGKGGNPWAAVEENRMRPAGTCQTMDFGAGVPRWTVVSVDSGLGPGTYDLKSFTELLLSKRTSKRGPYDLFTGQRSNPIISGYFAAPKRVKVNGKNKTKLPKFGEDLEKNNYGRFSSLERFPTAPSERIHQNTRSQWPRPEIPPVSAVIRDPRTPPFLSTAPRFSRAAEKQMNGNHNPVGPGRYDIAEKGGNTVPRSHRSSFLSRTQRYPHCPARDKLIQERLRATNIPTERNAYHWRACSQDVQLGPFSPL